MPTLSEQITLDRLAGDPYPLFQALLQQAPVCWAPAFGMWLVTRRADAIEILKDSKTFTMEPVGGQRSPMEDTFGPMMLSIDGPHHQRVREVFSEPFRARHVEQWYKQAMQLTSTALLDDLEVGSVVDLDKVFSDQLAMLTVIAALGLDVNDVNVFRDWYDDFAAAIGNLVWDERIRARGKRAFEQFRALVVLQLEHLAEHPNASILSQILHSPTHALTQDEIVSNIALTFFGGIETTSAMLSNTLWALLSHPAQKTEVQNDLGLLQNAIEESLRWQAPVQSAMRFPTETVTLHGQTIQTGEKIYCMIGAANRDPAHFEDPDRFDIHRHNASQHLSFAHGPHFCFGAGMARLEAVVGLSALLQRFPNLELDRDQPSAPQGHEFRSPPTLFARLYA